MSVYHILTSWMPQFFYSQFFVTPPLPSTDCTGKTIIVTGANTGLGKEAARHFVQLNAERVIIACRSLEKGEGARREIESSAGRSGVVEVWKLDLLDYDSVQQFAKRVEGLRRVDVLLENAGISEDAVGLGNTQKFLEVGGNESTITVNVVSTFLLALLVLPKLQETAKIHATTPNLTIVSSEVHFLSPAKLNERKTPSIFGTLNDPKQASMASRYNVSKLLEVLVCRQIAHEHPISDLNVTLNFVNPGLCRSELAREMPSALVQAFHLLARTTEVGSRTLVHAALAGPETHGKYLADARVKPCAPLVEGPEGPETQRRVWAELRGQLEGIAPGVCGVLD
ncbi:hypothetical protein LTR53_013891 [Teratosphaeriaceae sp. CCFEE 6253]|nr:hypothetical protein LTR53_013891 [Teratosphaeriaceae sp. CCFEE 6253]